MSEKDGDTNRKPFALKPSRLEQVNNKTVTQKSGAADSSTIDQHIFKYPPIPSWRQRHSEAMKKSETNAPPADVEKRERTRKMSICLPVRK